MGQEMDKSAQGQNPGAEFEDAIFIQNIDPACVKAYRGASSYFVDISVGKDVSENEIATVSVPKWRVNLTSNGYDLMFSKEDVLDAEIVGQVGQPDCIAIYAVDLKQAHEEHVAGKRANRRLPDLPSEMEDSSEIQME